MFPSIRYTYPIISHLNYNFANLKMFAISLKAFYSSIYNVLIYIIYKFYLQNSRHPIPSFLYRIYLYKAHNSPFYKYI
ncbi:hypothetical protein HGI32_00970 [Clostridium acetobutylicum]|uniref:Uncharacterized protein n=1 Tax=Clostridium acetobutylicum (strain ATCC 824 / DSM 792 / JCM 1419 / IAM 19013 / LMG 5710 / NBRC 13948 / NRRL B-527 / VKM B-1787 / 2291 / W) TaxID=272562 RepID=Q97LI5_CLOAB|nr:Hypothetical protein CA_C0576 [Clostridium acetobutylicum ATCC 824]AEI31320.1 hypothetical protein SMB_G0590 [Clostridium acetobutylicum DSM 1731]AWV80278.1 hypothetical protein DK921_09255 [Clostridium acetobutylicum]PSM06081.1 hypothetical protein C7T89_09250 [Clostridium sp. NJ4]MBC2392463.1 hypothetical protein [Clostridium acetobutylicum]